MIKSLAVCGLLGQHRLKLLRHAQPLELGRDSSFQLRAPSISIFNESEAFSVPSFRKNLAGLLGTSPSHHFRAKRQTIESLGRRHSPCQISVQGQKYWRERRTHVKYRHRETAGMPFRSLPGVPRSPPCAQVTSSSRFLPAHHANACQPLAHYSAADT